MAVYYKYYDAYYCDDNYNNQQFAARNYQPTFSLATAPSNRSNIPLASLDFTLGAWGISRSQVTSPIWWYDNDNDKVNVTSAAFPNAPVMNANNTGVGRRLKYVRSDNSFGGGINNFPNGKASYGYSSNPMATFLYNSSGGNTSQYVYMGWATWAGVTFWGVVNFNGRFESGMTIYVINVSPSPPDDSWYINVYQNVINQQTADWLNSVEDEEPTIPDTDPYGGIDGEGALPGDTVGLPDEPSLSALDAGMFALFSPTSAQMKALASYLWTDFGGAGTDVVQMLGEVVEALKRTVANPLDLVLGLSIVASQGLSKGSASNVHVGFWDTGVSMTRLAKQYFSVDCGSVSFSPVCGDTFLDYAPYSKFSIFLPYVGMKTLDANDVVGHSIGVKYRGDCVTGGLACYLLRDGAVIAEYSGSCALNLPLSSENWGATISSAIAIAAGGAAGAIAGGGAGAAAGAIKGAASVASNPSVLSPQIQYNGAVAGGAGHMASQRPFILREVVSFHSTSHFNTVTGYPSYYYRQLGDCAGFTQVVDVHLFGLTATADEVAEIERLLKEGVIL